MRENGFVLALWAGIGVAIGALLPFIYNVQVDGTPYAAGPLIGAGDRLVALLFGLLLAGLAAWTRHRPAFRRPIAIASLALSLLGFAGYCFFTLAGVAGFTEQTGVQVSWYPSIGALLSIAGCAACAVAAIVMLRTRPPAPGESR